MPKNKGEYNFMNAKNELISTKELICKLKKHFNALIKSYRSFSKKEIKNLNEKERFFWQNIHILQNEFGNIVSLKSKNLLLKNSQNLPCLGELVLLQMQNSKCCDNKLLIEKINELQSEYILKNCEFELLIWQVKYCILNEFIEIFFNQVDEEKMNLLLSLLDQVKLIECDKINEFCNILDKKFNAETANIYSKMKYETKLNYKKNVCFLAEKYNISESDLAEKYVKKSSEKNCHIGELIFSDFEKATKNFSEKSYIFYTLFLTIFLSLILSIYLENIFLLPLLMFPFFDVSALFSQRIFKSKTDIQPLPKMELSGKIDKKNPVLISVSTILISPNDINTLEKKLVELWFLNPLENVKILALCDLKESITPTLPEDDIILQNAKKMIKKINNKYGQKFLILIRNRTFSKTQKTYLGYERKRGAIVELVKHIKGEKNSFLLFDDTENFCKKSKFLLALDYDTSPFFDTLPELLSIALHPLNIPYIVDEKVVNGYGIISPEIVLKKNSRNSTLFSLILSKNFNSFSYNNLSQDYYQNSFSNAVFTGKGLMNIDAFYNTCTSIFPEEKILSHDLLEGLILRTAHIGEIVFEESAPTTSFSFFQRANRWARGDFQNFAVLFNKKIKNKFSYLDKFKIIDNARRNFSQIIIFFLLILSIFLEDKNGSILFFLTLIIYNFQNLFSLISSSVNFVYIKLFKRNQYTNSIHIFINLLNILTKTLLLPKYAYTMINAFIKAVYRLVISNKNLLEWTTAYQAEKGFVKKSTKYNLNIYPFLMSIPLIFHYNFSAKLLGIMFFILPILLKQLNLPIKKQKKIISSFKQEKLILDLHLMYKFYEDFAVKSENYLPPDNVQYAPIFKICHRTSPTNIGFYLLSILVARDFNFISTDSLCNKISLTLTSIEKMKKYKGNLYNWYDTKTLNPSPNPFVSSVDSGNFLSLIVALSEGLYEYKYENPKILSLINRINLIISTTEFDCFYNKKRQLFTVGINPLNDEMTPNYYDLLMSESQMMSYFAVAKRFVPKNHFFSLGRPIGKYNKHFGALSYFGTMFEYFMPNLLLKYEDNSLQNKSLKYALYCQKKYAKKYKLPYGISESGIYTFDNTLNYQYSTNGIAKTALKPDTASKKIISPYSTYITLSSDFKNGYRNLERIKSLGLMGKYGLYEAVDFDDYNEKQSLKIIKSYMAHHIGMSIIGISNALSDDIIKKRFSQNLYIKSADELLRESFNNGMIFKKDFSFNRTKQKQNTPAISEYFDNISPANPKLKLLTNGEYTLVVSNLGSCHALFQGKQVYIPTQDLLRRPQGAFFAVNSIENNEILHLSYLPAFNGKSTVEFGENSVSFSSNNSFFSVEMKVFLHATLPCEIRRFSIKNLSNKKQNLQLFSYIEPILSTLEDFNTHKTFQKLFLRFEYNFDNKFVLISKKNKSGNDELFCAIGFIENIDLQCCLSRENAISTPYGVEKIFDNTANFCKSYDSIPDPCVFLKTPISLNPNQNSTHNLFILTGLDKNEIFKNVHFLRNNKVDFLQIPTLSTTSIEGILLSNILPKIFFKNYDCKMISNAIKKNFFDAKITENLKINTQFPIICVEIFSDLNIEKIKSYLQVHKILKNAFIKTNLVFIFNENPLETRIDSAISKEILSLNLSKNTNEFTEIFLINKSKISAEAINLIIALSVHFAPPTMIRIGQVYKKFNPIKFIESATSNCNLNLLYGEFSNDKFIIKKRPTLPWCFVLANSVFGTLLSNNSLGYTYAFNSQKNMITPHFNDTLTDNQGEMLVLKADGKYYNLILNSECTFCENKAVYQGTFDIFSSTVTVEVSQKGMCKKISVEIEWIATVNKATIVFYTEPILAQNSDLSRLIKFEIIDNQLVFYNPLNADIKGFAAISSSEECSNFSTNREDFFQGIFTRQNIASRQIPCGAISVSKFNLKGKKDKIDFFLSFGKTKKSALLMKNYFTNKPIEKSAKIILNSPDKNFNSLFNHFLYNQFLYGRIFSRTGLYQISGGYGFRDQLQDVCGVIYARPEITKRHIYKSCTAQFFEGDVLHWWHNFDSKTIGVRTKISDDLFFLPYTVCEYIKKTSDYDILEKKIAYCEGIELPKNENDIFGEVKNTSIKQTVYEHCLKALDFGYKLGKNSLILIGSGDWNDSFNNVGSKGFGESVWLSQFARMVYNDFAKICEYKKDFNLKKKFIEQADNLAIAIENNAWDSEWYKRAFLDNGDALGSKSSPECRIDLLSQSFAVLSNLPNNERNKVSVLSAFSALVDKKNEIIKLFSPPFSNQNFYVGYANAYPKGIRENGGQYTHAAVWLAIALLKVGYKNEGNEIIKMLNPSRRYQIGFGDIYKTEPYFLAGDIYTNLQCYGRGGWSIYTGAASWYYRAILENYLGVIILNNQIHFAPNLPNEWDFFELDIDFNQTKIHIVVTSGKEKAIFDNGNLVNYINLDKKPHEVRIIVEKQ